MPKPMPSRYALSLLKMLQSEEDRQQVLLQVGVSLSELQSCEFSSCKTYCELFIAIVHKLQHQLHGEDANELSRLSNYRLILMSMVEAKTLGDAIIRLTGFFRRLGADGSQCRLITNGDTATLRFDYARPISDEQHLWSAEMFSMDRLNWLPGTLGIIINLWIWHRFCSWLIGDYLPPTKVSVQTPCSGSKAAGYQALFNNAISFAEEGCSISFDARFLQRSIVQNEKSTAQLLSTFPYELIIVDQKYASIEQRIRSMIGNDFSRPMPAAETIAERLSIGVATLHRRLQKQGTSYQTIKDQCRFQAAQDFLHDGETPIKIIAQQLNYSDVSTFHRAFKKWSGLSPAQFRGTLN
ncbi:AraC-like DNA-binding protein [Sinobacterium caligoides]|uniref:AraC-like DNA-binding protein n=1 Tax=Sinobacterium caligoides TaxID=933926 RepID=A0A3N2DXR9_9GAMM|nr:AraC family transcriptional regulator [Sinobacterium caligoides]ROS04608.1 AraC-like DNA-binding protein [Sinobacterium caligoides]